MKKKMEEYFVPWLRGQDMYVSAHLELAWQERGLHRMMSNENPHPPSPRVLEAIHEYALMAHRYPDRAGLVRSRIAEINGLDGPENVMIGNGSCEIFDMIFRSFLRTGDEVIQHTPCFGIYKLRCAILGGSLVSVPMIYEGGGFLFDADSIIAAATPKTKIIVVTHPNNPTGNFMSDADIIKIARLGVPFVVDEAYIEFAGMDRSQVKLVKDYPNVIITRTLSKAYGLAGLRFGYLLGDRDVVAQMSATLLPWNVGTIQVGAALASLEDTEALEERIKFNNREVEYIEGALGQIPGLTIFHSHANYILFDGGPAGKKGMDMVDYAQERGIILRPMKEMYGSDGFFRITLGTREENRMLVGMIREFFTS